MFNARTERALLHDWPLLLLRVRGGYLMKAIKTMLYYFACFMTFIACAAEILVLAYWEWIFD